MFLPKSHSFGDPNDSPELRRVPAGSAGTSACDYAISSYGHWKTAEQQRDGFSSCLSHYEGRFPETDLSQKACQDKNCPEHLYEHPPAKQPLSLLAPLEPSPTSLPLLRAGQLETPSPSSGKDNQEVGTGQGDFCSPLRSLCRGLKVGSKICSSGASLTFQFPIEIR